MCDCTSAHSMDSGEDGAYGAVADGTMLMGDCSLPELQEANAGSRVAQYEGPVGVASS